MCLPTGIFAQHTKVIPWQVPAGDPSEPLVYRPEPVLFIHGVNANDAGWGEQAIPALQPAFGNYQVSLAIDGFVNNQTNGFNAVQHPYLHTFNYGDQPGQPADHNRHSFEHVQWNAWADDRDFHTFTNEFVRPDSIFRLQLGPHDGRQTLDERINGVREAYAITINGVVQEPGVVLVAHSNGGLVSHYYLVRAGAGSGVRRLITLATPHLGSHVGNWLTWFNQADSDERARDSRRVGFRRTRLREFLQSSHSPDTVGFFLHGDRGAVWDFRMVDDRPTTPSTQRGWNRLIEFFRANPAPKLEYVFNVYHRSVSSKIGAISYAINQNPAMSDADNGDGVVPLESAAGKPDNSTPSIWNGNPSDAHDIDPVIYGMWPNLSHTDAPKDTNSIIKSLLGVPYRWSSYTSPNYSSIVPDYANYYDENQSFSKYLPVTDGGSVAYTDEPGVGDLKLLFRRSDNFMFIPALNTWDISNGLPEKSMTNVSNFSGHQVIGIGSGGSLMIQTTFGTKNQSQTPAQTSGTNYWIVDGNEYLPASLKVKAEIGTSPILESNSGAFVKNVYNCLVYLDPSGAPRFQYALCNPYGWLDVMVKTQNFVAVQARNLAGFVTPQAERAVDVPVDSATVVAILKKINQSEALSNGCHHATVPTRWTASIREWGTTDTGAITLNFFPTHTSLNIVDAWITNSVFNDFTYTYAGNTKTIRINDANAAPSQLIINYTAYLGCDKMFTNSDNGYVPALGKDTLAGVPINEAFLNIIRQKLEAIVPLFQNTDGGSCGGTNWVLTNILASAGYPSGTWLKVVNGLLLPEHFTQLKKVADKLTWEYSQFTLTANATLDLKNIYHLPDGTAKVFYSNQISVVSCTPSTLAKTYGPLPTGLILSSNVTGKTVFITGINTIPGIGTNVFCITATATNNCSTNQWYSLYVGCGTGTVELDHTTNGIYVLPEATNWVTYSAIISVTNWNSAYSFALTPTGVWPSELRTNTTSRSITISGMPTNANNSGGITFTLTATDPNGCYVTQSYSLPIWVPCNNCNPKLATSLSFSMTTSPGSQLDIATQNGGNPNGVLSGGGGYCSWWGVDTFYHYGVDYNYCPGDYPPENSWLCSDSFRTTTAAMAACLAYPGHGTCTDHSSGGGYGYVEDRRPDSFDLSWDGSKWELSFPVGEGYFNGIMYGFTGGTNQCNPVGTYYDSEGDSVAISAL